MFSIKLFDILLFDNFIFNLLNKEICINENFKAFIII